MIQTFANSSPCFALPTWVSWVSRLGFRARILTPMPPSPPEEGGERARRSAKGGAGGKKRRPSTDDVLISAAALHEKAQACFDAVAAQREQHAIDKDSLELWIGHALTREKRGLQELIREWDGNGDGEIQKIELRQVVRNKLKIKADNKQIDALFDKLDADGGGSLDMKEMGAALYLFKSAHKKSAGMEDELRRMEEEATEQAALITEAASAMAALEDLQAKLAMFADGAYEGSPLEWLAASVSAHARRTHTIEAEMKRETTAAWDPNKDGSARREVFFAWASGMVVSGAIEESELEACFAELKQVAGAAADGGFKVAGGLKRLWEVMEEIRAAEAAVVEAETGLRKAARKLQKQVVAMENERKAKEAERSAEELRAAEEKAAADAAAKEARAAEREAKKQAKVKEQASFKRRVDGRRQSNVGKAGSGPSAAQLAELADREKRIRAAFSAFDQDGDGYLTVDELMAVLLRPTNGNPSFFTPEMVMEFVREFDENGDGVLEFDEFAPLWQNLYGGGP